MTPELQGGRGTDLTFPLPEVKFEGGPWIRRQSWVPGEEFACGHSGSEEVGDSCALGVETPSVLGGVSILYGSVLLNSTSTSIPPPKPGPGSLGL